MSLRAITEFVLHLEHFRNVDLIQQGLYFMKFQIFNEREDKIYYANPYHQDTKDTNGPSMTSNLGSEDEQSKVSFHRLIEPYIVEETNSFYTKTFFVRYAEELVVLRDIVKFRTEIDIAPGYLETEFFLKAELFYQPPPTTNFAKCMSSAKEMLNELQTSGEQFKMVQARLYQINKGLTGISSFLPILFDREYTCLTMSTLHTALIDYRFRLLPQNKHLQHSKSLRKVRTRKHNSGEQDDEDEATVLDEIEINPGIFDEEDQTFIQNGIVVENKYDLTEQDKLKMRQQKIQRRLAQKWLPRNTTEYLFFDEDGLLQISEEQVKTLNQEFTSLMKQIYMNVAKKYEDLVKSVVQDADMDHIDFPLIASKFNFDKLKTLLSPQLVEKLGGLDSDEEEDNGQQINLFKSPKGKKEEFKQGELDSMNQQLNNKDQDNSTTNVSTKDNNDQQSTIQDNSENQMEKNSGQQEQAGHLKDDDDSEGDNNANIPDSSSEAGMSEGQVDESCIPVSPQRDKNKVRGQTEINGPRSLQVPKTTNKMRGIGIISNTGSKNAYTFKIKPVVEYNLDEATKIANALIMQINIMAGQLFELNNNFYKMLYYKPRRIYKCLSLQYQNQLEKSYGENILRHIVMTQDFSFPSEDFTGQLNDVVARKTREVIKMHMEMEGHEQPPVEELNIIVDEDGKKNRRVKNMERYAPLIFEECFVKNKGNNRVANTFEIEQHPGLKKKIDPSVSVNNYKGMHLFVLQHGFQGSSFDMRVFKNIISIALPDALFLCAASNEHDSDQNIFDMGQKLADEVQQYIRESCPGNQLGRLTFIGHSLGGLIIRAALPHLEKYKDKMHGYLTLCSPHLGYMYKSSKLITTSMWVLKSWKKSIVLNQLSMTDSKTIEQTALYRLSQVKGLEWFKHVILISSYQDQYAPFDSARLQICSDAAKDQKRGSAYIQMVTNVLGKCTNLDVMYRLDVNFNIEETSLDSMIGRTAHILFLENEDLMKMITSRYKMFFS